MFLLKIAQIEVMKERILKIFFKCT